MKLPPEMTLSAAATWLPPTLSTAAAAVAAGRLGAEDAAELDHPALPEATDLAPPQMAVLAARTALDRAGVRPDRIGVLLHAWIHHQGHDFWSPAHYIARELSAERSTPIGIQQMCNGGAAAVELAAARLLAGPGGTAALVTTADRFGLPGFDRWSGDYGIGYGDGATAAVLDLADNAGRLGLRAINSAAAPELEGMHRGGDPFSPAPRAYGPAVDVRRTKKAYLREHGMAAFAAASRKAIGEVIERTLDEAGLTRSQPRCVLLPRLGRKVLQEAYVPVVLGLTDAEPVDAGRDTGHLGAGDLLANLAHLTEQRPLAPGEHALVLGAGGGFSWSCLAVTAGRR